MVFCEIDDNCFKPFGEEKMCLHWVKNKYNDNPYLAWSSEILEECMGNVNDEVKKKLEHMKDKTDEECSCGNPWNILAKMADLEKDIRSKKPSVNPFPVVIDKNAVNFNIMATDVDEKKIINMLKHYINADC